jgi:hypothetical protein
LTPYFCAGGQIPEGSGQPEGESVTSEIEGWINTDAIPAPVESANTPQTNAQKEVPATTTTEVGPKEPEPAPTTSTTELGTPDVPMQDQPQQETGKVEDTNKPPEPEAEKVVQDIPEKVAEDTVEQPKDDAKVTGELYFLWLFCVPWFPSLIPTIAEPTEDAMVMTDVAATTASKTEDTARPQEDEKKEETSEHKGE